MPIWEYKIISLLSGTDQESTLNALGKDRWELVSLDAKNGDPVAYLKRESTVTNGGAMIEEIQGNLPAEPLPSSGISLRALFHCVALSMAPRIGVGPT